jgi:hypothetical protein
MWNSSRNNQMNEWMNQPCGEVFGQLCAHLPRTRSDYCNDLSFLFPRMSGVSLSSRFFLQVLGIPLTVTCVLRFGILTKVIVFGYFQKLPVISRPTTLFSTRNTMWTSSWILSSLPIYSFQHAEDSNVTGPSLVFLPKLKYFDHTPNFMRAPPLHKLTADEG